MSFTPPSLLGDLMGAFLRARSASVQTWSHFFIGCKPSNNSSCSIAASLGGDVATLVFFV